jgi:hypothetical protein
MTGDLISSTAAMIVAVCIAFAGGWSLRRLRDQHRADVRRDQEWDAGHGITRRGDDR